MAEEHQIKVWDVFVRTFHWTLVASFSLAYLLEDDFLALHSWAGYLVTGLIIVRILWGFVGPRHARFADFIHPPAVVLVYLKSVVAFRAQRYLGHNPAGGYMVIGLMIFLLLTCISGMAVYGAEEFSGPLASLLAGLPHFWGELFEQAHEAFANFTLFLVALHVVGVAVASLQHHENLLRSMFTGRKRSAIDQESP